MVNHPRVYASTDFDNCLKLLLNHLTETCSLSEQPPKEVVEAYLKALVANHQAQSFVYDINNKA